MICLLVHDDWFKIKEGSPQIPVELGSQNSINCLYKVGKLVNTLWHSLDIDKFEWNILVSPTGSKSFAAKVFHGWKLESNNLLIQNNFNAFNLLSMSISFKPPFSKVPINELCLTVGHFPLQIKSFWIWLIFKLHSQKCIVLTMHTPTLKRSRI